MKVYLLVLTVVTSAEKAQRIVLDSRIGLMDSAQEFI
jgi:hypothetical protein